jgi:hypothetical protein
LVSISIGIEPQVRNFKKKLLLFLDSGYLDKEITTNQVSSMRFDSRSYNFLSPESPSSYMTEHRQESSFTKKPKKVKPLPTVRR